jgi:hypothetical protein
MEGNRLKQSKEKPMESRKMALCWIEIQENTSIRTLRMTVPIQAKKTIPYKISITVPEAA